jgi:hypothetical protein
MSDYQMLRHYEHFSVMAVSENFTIRGFYSNLQLKYVC